MKQISNTEKAAMLISDYRATYNRLKELDLLFYKYPLALTESDREDYKGLLKKLDEIKEAAKTIVGSDFCLGYSIGYSLNQSDSEYQNFKRSLNPDPDAINAKRILADAINKARENKKISWHRASKLLNIINEYIESKNERP